MKHSKWVRKITPFLLIFGLLLSACDTAKQSGNELTNGAGSGQSAEANSERNEASAPESGGSINIAIQSDPKVMNPVYAVDRTTLTINQSLYAPLFYMDNGEKIYALAESSYASKDYKTYYVTLKKGLTWHDGEAITADDIIYTLEQIVDENQNSPFRSQYVVDGNPVKAVKLDELTVKLVLPEPSPSFEGTLMDFYPIPQHIYQGEKDLEASTKNDHPIGSGPYKFKEYTSGESVVLERFDNYYDGAAYLDSVTFKVMDSGAVEQALQSGEIQMSLIDIEDYDTLQSTGDFDLVTYEDGRLDYMVFNMNIPEMQNKEIREAIVYALDKEELIRIAYLSSSFADPAYSIFTPDTQYYTSAVRTYPYNLEKSKELLQQVGATELEVRLAYSASSSTQANQALYIQQKLRSAGIKVELKPMEATIYEKRRMDKDNTDFVLSLGGYIMGTDPTAYEFLYMSDGAHNYSHAQNKELDALWERASTEVDASVREQLYEQIQQKIAKELIVWPIAYTKSVIAVSKNYGGLSEADAAPIVLFRDLSKIYMK